MSAPERGPLRVIALHAENYKRLRVVEVHPDGQPVTVTGANAQGKSSLGESIAHTLAGPKAFRATSKPVRDGEEKATVTVKLGDDDVELTVTRTWTAKGTMTVTVETADGRQVRSPQKFLDELLGALSFDPLAFTLQSPREQRETLLSVVDLPFDPDELAEKRLAIFDRRTAAGRRVKELEAQLAGAPVPPADTPTEEVSVSGVLDEYREARALFDSNSAVRVARADAERAGERADEAVAAAQEALRVAEGARADAYEEYDALVEQVEALPPDPDLAAFEARIAGVEDTNRAVRAGLARAGLAGSLMAAKEEHTDLDGALRVIDETKEQALADAAMPVPGLSFDEDGVLYQGVPFQQASSSEQIRVSVAMAIALNPTVRVLWVADGSLLDDAALATLHGMAELAGCQLWIERVGHDDGAGVGFVLEIADGAVLAPESPA